jgi:hypothetical protein
MNNQQKKILENETLLQTQNLLAQNDLQVIKLISFAKDKNLFFPELYEMWYVSLVNTAVSKNQGLPHNSHEFFGLDLKKASQIYISSIDALGQKLTSCTPPDNKAYLSLDILTEHLRSGIFFNSEHMEKNYLVKQLGDSPSSLDAFKNLNTTNHAAWLDSQLPEKNDLTHRKQKI